MSDKSSSLWHWWIHSLEEGNSQLQDKNHLNKYKPQEIRGKLSGGRSNSDQVTFKLNFDELKEIKEHVVGHKETVKGYNSASYTCKLFLKMPHFSEMYLSLPKVIASILSLWKTMLLVCWLWHILSNWKNLLGHFPH